MNYAKWIGLLSAQCELILCDEPGQFATHA